QAAGEGPCRGRGLLGRQCRSRDIHSRPVATIDMSLSRRARRNWRIFFWFSLTAAVVSAYFGYWVRPDTPIMSTFVGVVTSLIIATPIALFELHSERIAFVRRLRPLPLAVYFGIKVVFYLVVIVGGLLLGRVI